MLQAPRLLPAGDSAMAVEFGDGIDVRINARVRLMMERGLLEEVRRLRGEGAFEAEAGQMNQAREAVGYKQLLAHLEGRMRSAIQNVESTLHQELTSQTWLIVKWVSGLLVTLLPSLMAATFYIARYLN
jgi:hypothetical protein